VASFSLLVLLLSIPPEPPAAAMEDLDRFLVDDAAGFLADAADFFFLVMRLAVSVLIVFVLLPSDDADADGGA